MTELTRVPKLDTYYVTDDITLEKAAAMRDILIEPGVVDELHVGAERNSALNSYGHNVLCAEYQKRYDGNDELLAYGDGIVVAEVLGPLMRPAVDPYDDVESIYALRRAVADIGDQFRLYETYLPIVKAERREATPILYALMYKVLASRHKTGVPLEISLAGASVFLEYHRLVDASTDPFAM